MNEPPDHCPLEAGVGPTFFEKVDDIRKYKKVLSLSVVSINDICAFRVYSSSILLNHPSRHSHPGSPRHSSA